MQGPNLGGPALVIAHRFRRTCIMLVDICMRCAACKALGLPS